MLQVGATGIEEEEEEEDSVYNRRRELKPPYRGFR
jgi:hypothetical protein